jgi:hypothetical protein
MCVVGGGRRDRTDDPLLAKQVLSQLSYAPPRAGLSPMVCVAQQVGKLVGLVGLEPTTPALSRRCSNHLSYRPSACMNHLSVSADKRGHLERGRCVL